MQRVVKVVAPLSINAITPGLRRRYDPGIVQVTLGNKDQMTAGMSLECPDFTRKLFQEMDRGRIEDGMDRVDAQAIEVIIAEPHERVVAEKAAHLSTVRAVEIQR